MILGDLGARVIKVERALTGDDTRQWRPPSWGDYGALFLSINRNKESIALDLDSAQDVAAIKRLIRRADVVIESNKPGSMAKRGLGFDEARILNPRIVYCSLSAFGSTGPASGRPGYDTIVQAASGVMSINGEHGGNPIRVGASIIDQGAGMWAAIGVLAALHERDKSGEAQLVETSLFETGVAWMGYHAANYLADGTVARAMGSRHSQMAPYEGFHTEDGPLFLAALNDSLFARMCAALGVPELAADDRFATNAARLAHRDLLHDKLQARIDLRSADEWERILGERGVPCARIASIDQVMEDPQVAALRLLRQWDHPVLDDLQLIDHPVRYNGVRSFQQRPAPELNQHGPAVLAEFHEAEPADEPEPAA
jgi:formyl-CoA transferase/CoA:oxalate CoA-transferase